MNDIVHGILKSIKMERDHDHQALSIIGLGVGSGVNYEHGYLWNL